MKDYEFDLYATDDGTLDLSNIDDDEFEESLFGETVLIVSNTDGRVIRRWMRAAEAVYDVLYSGDNGEKIYSSRIISFEVDMRKWDMSI